MATQYYVFYGTFKWAKVREPDKEFDKFSVCVYLDQKSLVLFNKSGLQLKLRDDEDGKNVRFARPRLKKFKDDIEERGPPKVTLPEGSEPGALVGNGSKGSVVVSVFDTKRGKGHELMEVRVTDLVPYTGKIDVIEPEDAEALPDAPAPKVMRGKGTLDDEIPF